jgi:hypothetical protein
MVEAERGYLPEFHTVSQFLEVMNEKLGRHFANCRSERNPPSPIRLRADFARERIFT